MLRQRALALLQNLIPAKVGKRMFRSESLLPLDAPLLGYVRLPAEDFCRGWAFRVGMCFADALDLSLDRRVKSKTPYYQWTQGSRFRFTEGYQLARADGERLFIVLEALEAEPAAPGSPRVPGRVVLQEFVRREGPSIWKKSRHLTMTQDDLVRMLIVGSHEPKSR